MEYIICGEYSFQPDMFLAEIHDALSRMSDRQREVFLSIMKTLAEHSDMWQV